MSRTAVVTGGASGMGLSICEHLADRGHRVAVLDLNGDGAEQTAADLRSRGAQAFGTAVDVSDRAAVDDALDKVRSELGPIEILVTSAGISAFVKFLDLTIDQWNKMLAVNLTGTFHCVQSAIPDMIAAKWGRIVLISSSSAAARRAPHGALRVVEGRRDRADAGAGAGVRTDRDHREHDSTVVDRHPDGPRAAGAGATSPTTSSGRRASRWDESGRATTSRPRVRSCAPRKRATSPARSSESTAAPFREPAARRQSGGHHRCGLGHRRRGRGAVRAEGARWSAPT